MGDQVGSAYCSFSNFYIVVKRKIDITKYERRKESLLINEYVIFWPKTLSSSCLFASAIRTKHMFGRGVCNIPKPVVFIITSLCYIITHALHY